MRDSLMVSGQANIQKELDNVFARRKVIKDDLDKLQAAMTSDADRSSLSKVVDARTKYVAAQEKFIKMVEEGKQEAAKAYLLEEAMALQDGYIEKLNELVEYQTGAMKRIGDEADKRVQNALYLITVIALFALAGAVVIGFLISRSISRPLEEAVAVAGAVAKGDLTSARRQQADRIHVWKDPSTRARGGSREN